MASGAGVDDADESEAGVASASVVGCYAHGLLLLVVGGYIR